MIFTGGVASVPLSSLGSWPLLQKHPVHTGNDGSPASNSIHTPAPTGGIVYMPMVGPEKGRLGSAQPLSSATRTAGTSALIRPIFKGSVTLLTVPRYLP